MLTEKLMSRNHHAVGRIHFCVALLFLIVFAGNILAQTTVRVSINSSGYEGGVEEYTLSADGKYLVFSSRAKGFLPQDTNNSIDVFLRNVATGATEIISVNTEGEQGNSGSYSPDLSADGRFVAFVSGATNLVGGDANESTDIFVRDRSTGLTERVSVNSSGGGGSAWHPALSADGRFVVFESEASSLVSGDTNGYTDIFLHDRQTGVKERVSVSTAGTQANNWSSYPAVSDDGRYVAFLSLATNLVTNDYNWEQDVFVHDRVTGTTELVSVNSLGQQANRISYAPTISSDGRFVVFYSYASNLVPGDNNDQYDTFIHDRVLHTTERLSVSSTGMEASGENPSFFAFTPPAITPDNRFVLFFHGADNLVAGDTNGHYDVFLHDRVLHTTERVSVSSTGAQANGESLAPCLSADARQVAFTSSAANLSEGDNNGIVDIFVRDRVTGITMRSDVSYPGLGVNHFSREPSISGNGRFIAFQSHASDLVPEDTNRRPDIFVFDRVTGETKRANVSATGQQANSDSSSPSLSTDGRFVAFSSSATNLVGMNVNGRRHIFVHDRETGLNELVSVSTSGQEGNGASDAGVLSADGRFVAFSSSASNLVSGDTNRQEDIFVHDRQTHSTERVNVSTSGQQGQVSVGDFSLSADGRFVAFQSYDPGLVEGDTNERADIFVRDRMTGVTERVSINAMGAQGNQSSYEPFISGDGRFVTFGSHATNLAAGFSFIAGRHIYVRDRLLGTTELVSISFTGTVPSGFNYHPTLSANGRYVAFYSGISNLVPQDTNRQNDVFVHDRVTHTTRRISVSTSGEQGNDRSEAPAISADGRFVTFSSLAYNLIPEDRNGVGDIFVHGPLFESNAGVSGKLQRYGRVAEAPAQTFIFTFRPVSHGNNIVRSVLIGASGEFSVNDLPADNYVLHVSGESYLAKNTQINLTYESLTGITITLDPGDANNDNSVDVLDLAILIQAFDSSPGNGNWNGNADFNGDYSIDVLDLDLLIQSFDRQGDD
jgi:hypothetical protein